ncbi:MAG: TonB-dependent receptor [Pseudomonadota bacterium]
MRFSNALLSGVSAFVFLALPTDVLAETLFQPIKADATLPTEQEIPSSEAQSNANGEIVVTGTRLRSGMTAPTPLVVVSADQLRTASPQQVSDALNQLPMFKGSSSPSNGTGSSSRDNGGSFLNLRGLGKERTLVLIDGRRMVAATSGGATDISLIPQDLIRSVDIVTGGASAAYGSDAVAGVVNFRLDTKFKGVRLNVQKGLSKYADAATTRAALTGGASFGGGGHIVASLEYYQSDGLGRDPTGRPISDFPYGQGPTGLASPTRTIVYPSLYTAAAGGLINTGPLAGNRFLPDGTVTPYNFGTNRTNLMQAGGDGFVFQSSLMASVKRYSAFTHADFDLGDVKVFGEALFSQADIGYPYLPNQQASVFNNAATIFRGNPYVNPAIESALFGNAGSITVSNIAGSTPFMTIDTRSRTYRFVGGFDWDIGSGWSVSAYGMHGENRYKVLNRDVGNIRNLFASLDAVRDPVSGKIVCRSTLSGFDPGCVPFNILGGNPISPEARAWAFGTSELDFRLKQDVASLSVRGPAVTLPAGAVDVAAGVEYRREDARQMIDGLSASVVSTAGLRGLPANYSRGFPGGWVFSAPAAFQGSYNVLEGFAEASVPIFKDSPFGYLLSLNGAIRLIRYSTVGTVTTWKAGATYEPFADLRLRGTVSRDIRAANIGELFSGRQLLQASVTYLGVQRSGLAIRSGNRDLLPEKADTLTAGVVYRPSWLPGLGVSVDYYRIKVRDAMAQLSATQTGDLCTLGAQYACDLISLDVNNQVTVLTPTLNLASLRTSGVDVEVDYSRELGPGNLQVKALVSYLHDLQTQLPNSPVINRAGDLGVQGAPKWQGYMSISYKSNGGLSVGMQERYIGSGLIDATLAPTVLGDANKVPATWYTDISLSQEVAGGVGRMKLYATVNNLFNQQPRITPVATTGPYRSTNSQLYDILGRYYAIGATLSF